MWPFARKRKQPRPADTTVLDTGQMGALGEKLARKHLCEKGYKILARNYRCPAGEADVVALAQPHKEKPAAGPNGTIVFVEVKTRNSDLYTDPHAAVDQAKQRRLAAISRYYLASRKTDGYDVRFDIVSIVIPRDGAPRINHIEDAF
jgi:putative endonuclease